MATARVLLQQVRRRRPVRLLRRTRQLKPVLLLRLACLNSAQGRRHSPGGLSVIYSGNLSVVIHVVLSVIP
jgi:hypothetical protein